MAEALRMFDAPPDGRPCPIGWRAYAELLASSYAKASMPPPELPLVDAEWLAQAFNVSNRTIRRWDVQGRMPRPIVIDRFVRWDRDEILAWCKAGCPERDDWEEWTQADHAGPRRTTPDPKGA